MSFVLCYLVRKTTTVTATVTEMRYVVNRYFRNSDWAHEFAMFHYPNSLLLIILQVSEYIVFFGFYDCFRDMLTSSSHRSQLKRDLF